jgi:elongation of very long chain fatty acids protein 6
MFIMSKLPELIDTVFIVLRKQPLIFLHWYHHATVLVYCWYSYHEFASSGRWFMGMNFIVHSIMYGYYALRALKFNISRHVSKLITTLQLIQMIIGCIVNYKAWLIKSQNGKCAISNENIKYSFIMYFTYFVLFFQFFINAYIKSPKKSLVKKEN